MMSALSVSTTNVVRPCPMQGKVSIARGLGHFGDAYLCDCAEPISSIAVNGMKQHPPESGYLRADAGGELWPHGNVHRSRFLDHSAFVEPVRGSGEECRPETSVEAPVSGR